MDNGDGGSEQGLDHSQSSDYETTSGFYGKSRSSSTLPLIIIIIIFINALLVLLAGLAHALTRHGTQSLRCMRQL